MDTASRPTRPPPCSIDLFAGCGGLTYGLEQSGFRCLAFNELNRDAADSFALNFPHALRCDGDIREALSDPVLDDVIRPRIDDACEGHELDLVCGGPPCQGFSGIGHRRTHKVEKKDIPTNHLFHEMVRIIRCLRPRLFLFENVQGILSGRWTKNGEKGEIFREVLSTFEGIENYTVQPTLLHAYGFGVPQNRPRVMIMGVRHDVGAAISEACRPFDATRAPSSYPSQLRNNGGFFPQWDETCRAPDVIDVLGDLDFRGWSKEEPTHRVPPQTPFQQEMRCGQTTDLGIVYDHEFSNHSPSVVAKFEAMHANGGHVPAHMATKKFNQKVIPARWGARPPCITVTSLPDDYVHYAQPRTLSVREWARLQTFPDHFRFAGKRTTGGARRAGNPSTGDWTREVPKYTQIGNAVPPRLARAIGHRMRAYLDAADDV